MKTSENGLALIRRFEGERLDAYLCPAGIPTVGVGHTGPEVHIGLKITPQQSAAYLAQDVEVAERAIASAVKVPLNQGQFDALVSFIFNLGTGPFRSSTLLRKLNAGDCDGAAAEFARWVHAGGRVLPGLVRRRAAEAALFGAGK